MNPDFRSLVIVALGANIGDSRRTISGAMARLEEVAGGGFLRSSIWRTAPVDCPPESPEFLNAVVGFVPKQGETPESLLAFLQKLEKSFGRLPKTVLNEPRPLDLDLIAFANETRNTPQIRIPHPRAHVRRFVLEPLSEIAPTLVLPGQDQNVTQLLSKLPEDSLCKCMGPAPA